MFFLKKVTMRAGHIERVAGGDGREADSVMGWCGRVMAKVPGPLMPMSPHNTNGNIYL